MNFLSLVASVFVAIAVGIVGWNGLSKNPSTSTLVKADQAKITLIDVIPSDTKAPQTSPEIKTSLTATNNGLTAKVSEYDLNPDHPYVTVCTDIPSISDWLPIFSASYNDEPIDIWMVMLIDPQNTAYKEKNRCYKVMLKEGVLQTDKLGVLTFTLDYFRMSAPEIMPSETIDTAKKYLTDKEILIGFELKNVEHGQIIVITKKPDRYTDEQAYQLIQEAIEQSIEKFYGPWNFTIDTIQE